MLQIMIKSLILVSSKGKHYSRLWMMIRALVIKIKLFFNGTKGRLRSPILAIFSQYTITKHPQVLGGAAPVEHGREGAREKVQPDRSLQEPEEDARQQERHDQGDEEEAQRL